MLEKSVNAYDKKYSGSSTIQPRNLQTFFHQNYGNGKVSTRVLSIRRTPSVYKEPLSKPYNT